VNGYKKSKKCGQKSATRQHAAWGFLLSLGGITAMAVVSRLPEILLFIQILSLHYRTDTGD